MRKLFREKPPVTRTQYIVGEAVYVLVGSFGGAGVITLMLHWLGRV